VIRDDMSGWFVYILECADGTLYTGVTRDLERRIAEHNHDRRLAARYTWPRRPVSLVYTEAHASRSAATRRESVIKRLDRDAKQRLVAEGAASGQKKPRTRGQSAAKG